MKIPHWFFWDYLTQYEGDKDQSYFDAYVFIKAVKQEAFKGHLRFKRKNGTRGKLYHKDSAIISNAAMRLVGTNHIPKIMTQKAVLLPIPNSDMTPTSGDAHKIIEAAGQLVTAYMATDPKYKLKLNSGLRWKSKKRPAHTTSGVRSMSQYEGKFSLVGDIKRPIILFDDVYTSGSQAKAACKFLTESGHTVLGIVTLAKTTHTPSDKAHKWREDVCEYDDDPFDWDEI